MPSARIILTFEKRELELRLSGLARPQATRIARAALLKAGKWLAQVSAAAAPRESGLLAAAMGDKTITYPSGVVATVVGPRTRTIGTWRGRKRWPAKYAHLVEHGTKPHSLASAVNMQSIRRGMGPWWSREEAERLLATVGPVVKRTYDERWLRAQLTERRTGIQKNINAFVELGRQRARDYLYRRDRKRGARVHPGTRGRKFMTRAWEGMRPQLLGFLAAEVEAGIARTLAA